MADVNTIEAAMDRIRAQARADGWENTILGLGGTKDPSAYTTYTERVPLPDPIIEAVYGGDHFAAKIVEALPSHAMRAGWDLKPSAKPAKAEQMRQAFAEIEDRLNVPEEMLVGAFWGRAFGGAITWIGANDGRAPDQPLDMESIKSVDFLHTFDRRQMRISEVNTSESSPDYRRPQLFIVHPLAPANLALSAPMRAEIRIHASRCIIWPGQPTTERRRMQLSGWDDSVLERCWEPLKQAAEDFASKSAVLGRVSQAVYKIEKLYEMIAGNQQDVLSKRMALLEQSRSRARAILLDTSEDFANVVQPLAGIDVLIDRALLRLSAAANMPVAVLLGQAISSTQSVGDGELELWDEQADAYRAHVLGPRHRRLAEIILRSKDSPTGGNLPRRWEIHYRPLRMPRPKELAAVRKMEAETDAIRVDKGMVSPEAIAMQRFAPSSGGDLVLDESELEAKLERRKELENQPPKDNAQLGTIAPRSAAVSDVITGVNTGSLRWKQGRALLMIVHSFTPEDAEELLGPEADTEPEPPPEPPVLPPGPPPDPEVGQGAGAPPQLPGVDDGGDPGETKEPGL